MRDLFRNEHAVILYYINVFMSPFTLSLHLFFDRPLFLRRAVDCHYKTRQTAARQTDTRQTGKTRQTVARQTGIASKRDAPNWTASNRHASIYIYNSILIWGLTILKSGARTPRTVTKFAVKTAIDMTQTI